jgi:hypothetical protein
MCIVRGYPTYNDTKSAVMLSATNVECVHWEKYTFRHLINTKGVYNAINNQQEGTAFDEVYDFATNLGQQIININDGIPNSVV